MVHSVEMTGNEVNYKLWSKILLRVYL
jgi:hypothetical protein